MKIVNLYNQLRFQAIANLRRNKCRCHGVTGSCTLTTCWDTLPAWEDVTRHLRSKFESAIKVQLANDGKSLLPTRRQRLAIREYPPAYDLQTTWDPTSGRLSQPKSLRRRWKRMRRNLRKIANSRAVAEDELVYAEESPNFCKKVKKHGTLGTEGRRCIPHTTGSGSCSYLCCGRGASLGYINETYSCNCDFSDSTSRQLICDNCTRQKSVYYCN